MSLERNRLVALGMRIARATRRSAWALALAAFTTTAVAQEFLPPSSAQPARPILPPIAANVDTQPDPGRFEILEADAKLISGVYFLDARIDYRLSAEARGALESGVPLTIRLDVELLNRRRFWFDNEDASLRQRYKLEYHALSERYLVENLNSGDQSSFSTLYAALAYLGRVNRLPLIDASLLDPGRDYYLRMRAVLDVEQFPGPLRLIAFWRRDWSIGSDWYRWQLRGD